jgi:hypothetical protein
MALNYTVRIIDRLLRFDTTKDDVVATLLPFAQTPNAIYEIHKISTGDGHTVTITVNPSTTDFLLPDRTISLVLDDTNHTVYIKIPANGLSPAYVNSGDGGGGGGGGGGVPAPPVTINPPAEVIFRSDHKVEVDIPWTAAATANPTNFLGVAVYLEDPDISSGANPALAGATDPAGTGVPLNATSQVSGEWAPVFVNESTKSPAVLFLDTTMGSTPDQTYKTGREVRIYLASYGPFSHSKLVRATSPSPTPNIMVDIPLGPGQGESGQEYAFLVTNVQVTVTTDYNRPDPKYYLTFFYDPPDPATPVPPNMNRFGGCRIVYVYEDANGNPVFPGTDTGIDVPVAQSQNGYKSSLYDPGPAGSKFRCYFCSEDDSMPVGMHINSLIDGVTPYAEAVVPPVPATPDVSNFTIANQRMQWLLDGSFLAEADFAWSLPTADQGSIRYTGVILYLVNVTGTGSNLTTFPQPLTSMQASVDSKYTMDIPNGAGAVIPATTETWTIAAISVGLHGVLADDPKQFGQTSFHSPTVTWNVGPPQPGSPGSGTEHAPLVTVGTGATAAPTESLSSDGVRTVNFNVGPWTNPTDSQFGGAQLAMVVNHDPTKPTYWSIPNGATSFVTPTIPAVGPFGQPVPVDFYVVSDDPQGHKNSLIPGTTPVIHYTYTPTQGAVIPARSGWFDPKQFAWSGSGFQAESFSAGIIQVGKTLVVGGAPASFGGSDNGQIAVLNSSGVLRAWMGEQQPGQGDSQPKWGAWFGQLWVGGTNPLDAPLWIDNNGIVEVGGIAAAQASSAYPYISVRDDHGIEMGRIGAKLNVASGTAGDSVGSSPPQLTSGAWFTQLGIGGNTLSQWNVLITPDATNPLGSQFLMRNIRLLSIDYPAQAGSPANNEYKLEFGSSVWMAGGLTAGQWQFPGIHMYEVDNSGNNFGATFLSRGLVFRGTQSQGYPVLVSLVTFNGNSSGSDVPTKFWGELAMYSPVAPYNQTVYLASGSSATGTTGGTAFLYLRDVNGNNMFVVDQVGNVYITGVLQGQQTPGTGASTPVNAYAYSVNGYGPVIDSAGNWKGRPITSGTPQTPWAQNINAAGFSLSGAGNIQGTQYYVNAVSNAVINQNGQFVGPGVDVGSQGIACGYLTTRGGSIDTGTLNASANVNVSGQVSANNGYVGGSFQGSGVSTGGSCYAGGGYTGGAFGGAGVNVGSYGITCGYLTTGGRTIDTGTINASGQVNTNAIVVGGIQRCTSNGIWQAGVQCNDHVFGSDFGIFNVATGWNGGFYDRDGIYHTVRGGIITN